MTTYIAVFLGLVSLALLAHMRLLLQTREVHRQDAHLEGRTLGYGEGSKNGYDRGYDAGVKLAKSKLDSHWMAGFDAGVISKGLKKRAPSGKFVTDARWQAEKL